MVDRFGGFAPRVPQSLLTSHGFRETENISIWTPILFFWGENIFLAKPEIVAHSLLPLFHPWPNQGGSLITAFHLIRIRYNFHPLSPDDFHPLSSGNFHTLSPGNFHFHQITFVHFHRITFIILITNTCSHLMLFNKVTTIDVTFSTTKISPSRPAIAWFSPGEM